MDTPDAPILTHLDPEGGVHMVDTSSKSDTVRTAVAEGKVLLGADAFEAVKEQRIRKGDVISTAQLAGIMGAKETSRLIPLCHAVNLRGIDVDLSLDEDTDSVTIRAFAKTVGATGVEMEALTAVSVAALTLYDMCKSVSKGIRIHDIHLVAKTGGQSGNYRKDTP
ncbi:MAG: cyclic pyranopterin monophosphate synthase MoaC [Rhodothermales bacterium]|nr:cyclic pyranopterin monophosphate synthase MoaC [Rhodothermales bacterium]MBO6778500.1 cyclic pyranopterin monophosphate synthase MoaC [Rhodothermales bacterium]